MRNLIAAIGLTSLIVAGAMTWNMPQSRAAASDSLPAFTTSNMTEVLTGLGATSIKAEIDQGLRLINFTHGNRFYTMTFHACDKGGSNCKGLGLLCTFEPDAYSHQVVNKYNIKYAIGKAVIMNDGALSSFRYLIADDGIPRNNVVSEIQTFFWVTDKLVEFINSAGVVASLPGQTRTLSYSSAPPRHDPEAHGGTVDAIAHLAPKNRLN